MTEAILIMTRCTEKVIPLNNCTCGNILPFGVGNVAGGEREEISRAGCQREGKISRCPVPKKKKKKR